MKFIALGIQETRATARAPGQANGVLLTRRHFLFGAPTVAGDIPKSGNFTYRPQLVTSLPYERDGGGVFESTSGDIQVSQGMARITGTLDIAQVSWVTGMEQEKGRISFSGTITTDANEISGSISGSTLLYRFTGEFAGHLYGPQGSELGLVFILRRELLRDGSVGTPIIGILLGQR